MFQTRKQLKNIIAKLEAALAEERRVNAFINNSDLPKCRSTACVNCKHIIYKKYHGQTFVLGCGKDFGCQDFEREDRPAETQLSLQEDLLSQQEL